MEIFSEKLKGYTWDEISKHKKRTDCWLLIAGKVYDVTDFDHPGGWQNIVRASREDATDSFFNIEAHKSEKTESVMAKMLIGILQEKEYDEEINENTTRDNEYIDDKYNYEDDYEWYKVTPVKLEIGNEENESSYEEITPRMCKGIMMLLLVVFIMMYVILVKFFK